MPLLSILRKIPDDLPNLKKNFENFFIKNNYLSDEHIYIISLAVSYSLKSEILINHFKYEATIYIDESCIHDIKSISIIATYNNVYYKGLSLLDNLLTKDHSSIHEDPMQNINIDKIILMMSLLAISSVKNCNDQMSYYCKKLIQRNISEEVIVIIIKMASTLSALSDAFEIESLRCYEFISRDQSI